MSSLWQTPHADGFRLHAWWDGHEEVVYTTDLSDDGSWEPVMIADINRDAVPDLLLQASNKYSLSVLRLLLSRAVQSGSQFHEVATARRAAC